MVTSPRSSKFKIRRHRGRNSFKGAAFRFFSFVVSDLINAPYHSFQLHQICLHIRITLVNNRILPILINLVQFSSIITSYFHSKWSLSNHFWLQLLCLQSLWLNRFSRRLLSLQLPRSQKQENHTSEQNDWNRLSCR